MATYDTAQTRHANTGVMKIDGEIIAECVNISVRESGGTSPVQTVGTPLPVEHTHDRYSVSVSISRVVFKRGALNKYGVGGNGLLTLPTVDVEGQDEAGGASEMLFKVMTCTISDRSMSIAANQRISGDMQLMGRKVIDRVQEGLGDVPGDDANAPVNA